MILTLFKVVLKSASLLSEEYLKMSIQNKIYFHEIFEMQDATLIVIFEYKMSMVTF